MYCGMWLRLLASGPAQVAGLYTDDERATAISTLPPRIRVREAIDRLPARGADPRVRRLVDRRGRRRGVAQEALDRRDDGGRLLGRCGRGDDLELRPAVGHRSG